MAKDRYLKKKKEKLKKMLFSLVVGDLPGHLGNLDEETRAIAFLRLIASDGEALVLGGLLVLDDLVEGRRRDVEVLDVGDVVAPPLLLEEDRRAAREVPDERTLHLGKEGLVTFFQNKDK